eukprot:COSAG01_NODE_48830_length_377_cov_1.474820_1_plen_54_part_01
MGQGVVLVVVHMASHVCEVGRRVQHRAHAIGGCCRGLLCRRRRRRRGGTRVATA